MNLAYLEFIGAIEVDRTPVAVNPAISFDKPIGKKSVKQFTYIDTHKTHKSVNQLKKELAKAKEEQSDAIRYLYNELKNLCDEYDVDLSCTYIKHELEEVKLPRALVRENIICDGTGQYDQGDIIFTENSIVLFMEYFNYRFLDALSKKYSKNINIYKGILSKDPIEIHIDMSEVTGNNK